MRMNSPLEIEWRLLDGTDGEAGDEAVEEEVVQESDGQAGDEAGGHQRSPVVDVATHQKNRDASADHLIRFRRDERQSIDKFLGHKRKGENHNGENSRGRNGNHHPDEGAEAREAVDHGGVFEFTRDGFEKTHQKPDGKRHGKAGINEDQRPQGILQTKIRHHPGKGNKKQWLGYEVGEKDADAKALSPAPGEAGQGVGSGDSENQGDGDDDNTDESGVAKPADEASLGEKKSKVFEGGLGVEDERVVLHRVEIEVLLETGDHHPIEREGEQDGEDRDYQDVDEFAPDALRELHQHQVTSAR